MQVARPDLPPVHGLVDETLALAYWQALTDPAIEAAPLHLLQQLVTGRERDQPPPQAVLDGRAPAEPSPRC